MAGRLCDTRWLRLRCFAAERFPHGGPSREEWERAMIQVWAEQHSPALESYTWDVTTRGTSMRKDKLDRRAAHMADNSTCHLPSSAEQVVIDEASQATEPRCLIAFQCLGHAHARAKLAVISGIQPQPFCQGRIGIL